MADLVKEMLGKFIELSQEEKQIAADMDAAYKEYTDYCADSEKDLNKKIEEIHEKMSKLNRYIEYAREHADPNGLEEASEPFDTPEGTLVSLQQTIQLESHSDPNAETLYTKATGKKLFYEQEIERTRQLIEGSKVQAKRQYDSDAAKLNKRKGEHFEKVRGYVQSREFSDYLKLLVYDKSAFNSPGAVTLNDEEHISLGQRRVKLSLPMEIEQDVAINSNGEYNAASRTIGAPMQVSSKKGSTLFLEHDERNGQYLLGGIQRLLLNFIKYFGEDISSVLFCEPNRFTPDSLGNISSLGMGINPFITVPKSMNEVEDRVARFAAKADALPTPYKVSRILVLLDFPEKYSAELSAKVMDICRNAEKTGSLVIITHAIPSEVSPLEAEIRKMSEVIRSRNGGFWIERTHESLFWYSAPSDISEDVRRVYVEKRRQDALNAAQEPEPQTIAEEVSKPAAPAYTAPAEKPEPAQPTQSAQPTESVKPEPAMQPRHANPFADDEYFKNSAPATPAPVAEPAQPTETVKPEPAMQPRHANPFADDEYFKNSAPATPAPVAEPAQPAQPAQSAEPAPAMQPRHANPFADDEYFKNSASATPAPVTEPAQPANSEMPSYTSPAPEPTAPTYEDDNLNALSMSDDGKPVPAHILFNMPRPKPEEKEVTVTVMSELSEQLPPPEEDVDPFQAYDFRPDYRPEQNIDPEYTYRITDHPQAMASASATASAATSEPEPTYERRNPIKGVLDAGKGVLDAGKGVIDAGRKKIGEFVDNRKSESAAKNSARISGVNLSLFESEPTVEETPIAETVSETESIGEFDMQLDAPVAVEETPVEEPIPEPEPEPVVEDVFEKGIRKLPAIPIGKDNNDYPIKMDISGNITYICGSRGEERKKITERVIAEITATTHPDDVELWLLDCGDGEFRKYTDDPAAHIKYLISDIGGETSLDFVDVILAELKRRTELFAENEWSGMDDVPTDMFMPRIVVAVNAFTKFIENIVKTPKFFGRNQTSKLAEMFKSSYAYGIHYLLIGDEFSENGEMPSCFDGCTIHNAAVVAGQDHAAHKLFGERKLYENEIESLKKVPAGCAFTADPGDSDGLILVRITGANAVNEHTFTAVSDYSEDVGEFVDKHPFIGNRKTASAFDDRSDYRAEQIKNRTEDECLLFLGEPCRFMGEYPVRLFDDFGENMFAIAPARERNSAAQMVRAALRSLDEQGIKTEVLAYRSNPVYAELMQCEELTNITVYEGAKSDDRMKTIVEMLDKGESPNAFVIILGGDLLVASLHADDNLPILKRALVKGPRVGTHIMFVSGSVTQEAVEFLPLFRHKLVFACPYSDAEKLLRDPNCDLPENGFRLSNDDEELSLLPYSM